MRDYFDWTKDAACQETDPHLFESHSPSDIDKAKRICQNCPVKDDCLSHSVVYDEVDLWGGMLESERQANVRPDDRKILASLEQKYGIFHPELIRTQIP